MSDTIESYLPAGQLQAVKVAEAEERKALEVFEWSAYRAGAI